MDSICHVFYWDKKKSQKSNGNSIEEIAKKLIWYWPSLRAAGVDGDFRWTKINVKSYSFLEQE